jgi:hypothetical protein
MVVVFSSSLHPLYLKCYFHFNRIDKASYTFCSIVCWDELSSDRRLLFVFYNQSCKARDKIKHQSLSCGIFKFSIFARSLAECRKKWQKIFKSCHRFVPYVYIFTWLLHINAFSVRLFIWHSIKFYGPICIWVSFTRVLGENLRLNQCFIGHFVFVLTIIRKITRLILKLFNILFE